MATGAVLKEGGGGSNGYCAKGGGGKTGQMATVLKAGGGRGDGSNGYCAKGGGGEGRRVKWLLC